MKARILFVLASLLLPAAAQQRVGLLQVLVAPDHADWKYAPGQKPVFHIRAVRDGANAPGLAVTYTIGPEMLEPVIKQTVALPPEGLKVEGITLNVPGLVRCIATIEENGNRYRGLATAAFVPEKIQPTVKEPADFDAFWQAGKEELAKVPVEAERTLLPELSTAKVNVYHVSILTVGPGARGTARVFGLLSVPAKPGKYPALLRVPGAGVHKPGPMVEEAAAGVITLTIGIHGIPLTMDIPVYNRLIEGALNGYWTYGLDNRDRYYYRRVYLSCVRAVDYLVSLDNWDGKTLAVIGGSQGGALSIITAALDPRIKALAAFYPALSDTTGYLEGRAGGWPHMFRQAGEGSHRTPDKIATVAYYDVVNFARRLRQPGIYSWGYNDETCPPTSIYAAYNVITAPKKLLLALETGHSKRREQDDLVNAWMMKYLTTGQVSTE